MKYLTVFRHAKSDWDDPVARDFDRPLNGRGTRAARLMGQFAAREAMRFDSMIASPAVRCVETLNGFFDGYGSTIEPIWDRRVYLASSVTLLDVVRETPRGVNSLILVGHNPGLEDLVLGLVPETGEDADSNARRALVELKFPTASIAHMAWAGDDWSRLSDGTAQLLSFTRPRDLDPSLAPNGED